MRKLLSVLVGVYFILSASAQDPTKMPGTMQAPPGIGRIYGKLVDSTGKAISDASVLILQNKYDTVGKKNKDVLLKGVTSQANGDFNLEDLPVFTPLKLKISALGHKPVEQIVRIQPKKNGNMQRPAGQTPDISTLAGSLETDLGKITMQTDVQQLQNVIVAATTSRLRMDIDKKVFNVDRNIVSTGGTAIDVMKNVPSVNVDIDGNVTLRNATPQIYIDGRPTTLSLDQIPADAIESVEVITNPSAKYDASGGNAGILNIVLKKNKKLGYNGTLMGGVDKRGGMNGGGGFNMRQTKINVSVNAFANQMRNRGTSNTDIRSFLTSPNLLVNQNGNNRTNGGFLFGKVGLDYFATNRTTFSIGAVRVHGEFKPSDVLTTDSSFSDGTYKSYSERNTNTHREFNAHGFTAGFKYLFPRQGEELTADLNFFSGKNNSDALYNTNVFTSDGGTKTGNVQQQVLGGGTNQFLTLQTDYVKPFKGSAKLEAGARAQIRKLSNSLGNYYFNFYTNSFELIPSTTSNYNNEDNIYAAYGSFTNSIKNFGYKIGLRAESSNYTGELTDTKQTFKNDYPISLFPSVFLSQKLSNKQEIQFSYTRRINRPFFMQLIPFIDSSDQLNWSRGNAGLKPEFINSLEMSYTKNFKGNNTLLTSVYYKRTNDMITRFLDTISAADVKRPISIYINANSSRSYGAEFTSQNQLNKWWNVNTNINVYNSRINVNDNQTASQDAIWSWFGKMNNNFKLPRNFTVQLSGNYQSKANVIQNRGGGFGGPGGGGPGGPGGFSQSAAQGYIKANYSVDAAIKKSFLKNNAASVTFSVNDIFRTRAFDQHLESPFFVQDSHRIGDSPMMRLTFSWRFGKMDMSLFKRKNTRDESMQNATEGICQ
ncbi:MAG: TonB-dependent receptor [Chitinophagaceae bacterium]|nr:TonB-dependent receptor [Chitinophagaceae bacterium]